MINFILNDTDSSEVFKNQAYQQEGVAFAPKLVHTGSFTIESYLAFGKPDFEFDAIVDLYEQFMLPKKSTRLFELEHEPLLIVHYWSHLLVNSKHTILDLPDEQFSEEFILALKHLISFYNKREITIITKNKRVIEILKQLDGTPKKLLPTYTFKMNRIEIANMFIGEKLMVFASLILALMIIVFAIGLDSRLVGNYGDYLKAPNNVIFIENVSTDCSFNQQAYELEASECEISAPIKYEQLIDLVNLEGVDSIIFDDVYNLSKLEKELTTSGKTTASVPNLGYTVSSELSTLPCLNPEQTPDAITCSKYNPDNSLISTATKNNTTAITNNIEHNQSSNPGFVILETSKVSAVAKQLVTLYPSINIYSNQALENYIRESNIKFLINTVLSGTLISLVAVFILNLLISQLKLYMRGHKYLLSYLTKKPVAIHRLFYLSQLIYFGMLFIIGAVIVANITASLTALIVSCYFGILNIILWIKFSDLNGVEFRVENKLVYNRILNKSTKTK